MTGKRYQFAAAAILIVGFASAIWIYLTAAPSIDDPLGLENSRQYIHALELYGGKANVLAVKLNQWFDSLWHGTRLAYTVACAAVLLAGAFMFAAFASED